MTAGLKSDAATGLREAEPGMRLQEYGPNQVQAKVHVTIVDEAVIKKSNRLDNARLGVVLAEHLCAVAHQLVAGCLFVRNCLSHAIGG